MNWEKQIQESFCYDPASGEIFWKLDRPFEHFKSKRSYQHYLNNRAGKLARSSLNAYGYPVIGIKNKVIAAHLIIYVIMTGRFPTEHVDHIDGDPQNNKWVNLREVTQAVNTRNQRKNSRNTSGFAGVYWAHREKRWASQVTVDGITKRLGTFDSPEEAYKARLNYLAMRPDLGYTERHGC